METIIVTCQNMASLFMGYTVNAGWRCQGKILALKVSYDEWSLFNNEFKKYRVNLNEIDKANFMLDIAVSQYNELIYAISHKSDATLIMPFDENEEKTSLSWFNDKYNSIYQNSEKKYVLEISERNIHQLLNEYYKRIKTGPFTFNKILDNVEMSDWNKQVYRLALLYPLLQYTELKTIPNIDWR